MSTPIHPFLKCKTRADLARLLGVKPSTLTYVAYGSGKKYRSFKIPKKGGGHRLILAPKDSLISVQRKLLKVLSEVYQAPHAANGFIPGKSILSNAEPHIRKRAVLNFDLEDFFPSITAARIIRLFKSPPFNFPNEVASALAALTCYENKLPQGAPTSPVISNMICFRLDRALSQLAMKYRLSYTRYADDITFSSGRRRFPKSVLDIIEGKVTLGEELKSIVDNNYFRINSGKTRVSYGTRAKYVTGVKVNTKANIYNRYVRQVRAMLHAWEKFGLSAAESHFQTRYGGGSKPFIHVVSGKLAHLKNIKGDADLVFRRLFNKFVSLEGKGRPQLPVGEIESLLQKVFVVQTADNQGTAFILNNTILITCEHVVRGHNEISYFNFNEFSIATRRKSSVDLAKISPEFDLAFLTPQSIDRTVAKSFTLAPVGENIGVEDYCRIIGFPGYLAGDQPAFINAQITRFLTTRHGIRNAVVDRVLISGCSGGVVLNRRNEVIGVVARGTHSASTSHDWDGYTFIPADEIRRFAYSVGIVL